MAEDSDYEVGYGNPPKDSQFKKGRSGNPKGRPKKDPSVPATFRRIAKQKVRVNGKDGPQLITKLEASITQVFNKAAMGDLKAAQMLIKVMKENPELIIEEDSSSSYRIVFVAPPKYDKSEVGVTSNNSEVAKTDGPDTRNSGLAQDTEATTAKEEVDEWWKRLSSDSE